MYRTIGRLIIAFATMIAAAGAQAASIDFDIDTRAFPTPALHFDYADGAFVWDRKPVIAAFTAKGSVEHGFEWTDDALLVPEGTGGQPLDWRMPSTRDWMHSGSIILSQPFLAPYAVRYADICAHNASAKETVFTGLGAAFSVTRSYAMEGQPTPERQAKTTATLPLIISCAARNTNDGVPSRARKMLSISGVNKKSD
jgi:hypothetical protein